MVMTNFVKPFLEKGTVRSLQKIPDDWSSESNIIKFLQRIIFKHDVVVELKEILNSTCSSKPFTVENETVRQIVVQLIDLLLLGPDASDQSDVFRYLFLSFAASSKGDDCLSLLQFFVVLCHILGLESPNVKNDGFPELVNREQFNEAFKVHIPKLSSHSYWILKELLRSLSKLSINLSSSEVQPYYKWLQCLIKKLTSSSCCPKVLMEIYVICADIDLRLVEGNLEDVFSCILTQCPPVDKTFCVSYNDFLTGMFKSCAKFQRTLKFVSKFLSSVKTIPTLLTGEIILPLEFLNEFSNIMKMASTQQSILLMELLAQNLDDCCVAVEESNSEFGSPVFFVACKLLTGFLKEVKLFSPSISSTTLEKLIDKQNSLKSTLKRFGEFIISDGDIIKKNDNSASNFLEVCFYCGEVEMLINCYKDSVSHSEVSPSVDDSHCSLSISHWNMLVKTVVKSKLEMCSFICFQLALQKLRAVKLKQSSLGEDTTAKAVLSLFTLNLDNSNIFQRVTPEDMSTFVESLNIKQARLIVKKLFKEILKNADEGDVMGWLSNPTLQENQTFVVCLFSELIKETWAALKGATREKYEGIWVWLLVEYFDDENNIREDGFVELPEMLNALMGNGGKLEKWWKKSLGRSLEGVAKVMKRLPLVYMKEDFRQLGLSLALGVAVASSNEETTCSLALESVHGFLASDTDASICFDVGLAIRWLNELSFEGKEANNLKVKVIEGLVRTSPNTKFGLSQVGGIIDGEEALKVETGEPLKLLETQVVLYQELGKCWQRAKKRKAENDLIGTYRSKLAKMISERAKELDEGAINGQNSKLLLKIFTIQLNKAIKMEEDTETQELMAGKFPRYFDFAVEELKKGVDEASASFLYFILGLLPQLRKFAPGNTFQRIWQVLRTCEKGNWRLFSSHSLEEEFQVVLDDLLEMSRGFLSPGSKCFPNCFEIWVALFEEASGPKVNACLLRLQELFEYIHDCSLVLGNLSPGKKACLVKFFAFCLFNKKVILNSHMLDTVFHVMVECLDDFPATAEEFQLLFEAEVEVAFSILAKQFDWTKNRVHLTFVLFKRMLGCLTRRCDAGGPLNNQEVLTFSNCALSLERWTGQMCKREKDFARTAAYFITAIISSIASVTVLPAIKIHLINCINHLLSISDTHTVSYLLRILKPGYQQVFNGIYTQFKKYHKYTGKI